MSQNDIDTSNSVASLWSNLPHTHTCWILTNLEWVRQFGEQDMINDAIQHLRRSHPAAPRIPEPTIGSGKVQHALMERFEPILESRHTELVHPLLPALWQGGGTVLLCQLESSQAALYQLRQIDSPSKLKQDIFRHIARWAIQQTNVPRRLWPWGFPW